MKFNFIKELLDRYNSKCVFCGKRFRNNSAQLKKRTLICPNEHLNVDISFSTTTNNVRIKPSADVDLIEEHFFQCKNNRHHHEVKFRISFNPRRLIITDVRLMSEEIKFKKERRNYFIEMDFAEPKMSFQDPGGHRMFHRPSTMLFKDREDVINKIESWIALM